jgi:hypothetical protein
MGDGLSVQSAAMHDTDRHDDGVNFQEHVLQSWYLMQALPSHVQVQSAQHSAPPPSVPPSPPPSDTAPPAGLDPNLIRAFEEQLAALSQHQASLLEQIKVLNSSIEMKDARITELATAGGAADAAEAREERASRLERERMLGEMAALRAEVTRMQSQMAEAAELKKVSARALPLTL